MNVPSMLRAHARPRCSYPRPVHESQSSHTFIGLVYSQFELVKIKLKKVNYNFFFILGSL
jgi:hypothetical protein